MVERRRGGAVALLLLLLSGAAACDDKRPPSPPGGGPYDRDAAVFQRCTSICRRPGDCEVAYPDDGICPPGFLCALNFTCTPTD